MWISWIAAASLLLMTGSIQAQQIKSPEEFLGHQVGADYKLARYAQIREYFLHVAENSDRVRIRSLGKSTEGRDMILAEITDSATPGKLDRHLEDRRKIADPRLIEDDDERQRLIDKAKMVVLLSCSIHATEVGAAQMSMELVYELATDESDRTKDILEKIIIVIIPCTNPDGLDIVKDWYDRTLGKPWEGARTPWLYQKYSGHDNNRDWFMFNLLESRNVAKMMYEEWFPTMIVDLHQMGNSGARLFLPPFYDPLNPNIDAIVTQTLMLMGGHIAADLTVEGKTGVIHANRYDNWAAGKFRSVPYTHNMICALTEMASVSIASPVFQRKRNLRNVDRDNNYPNPWPGGWWRLRDIVEYEKIVCWSLFKLAARYHEMFTRNHIMLGEKAIEKGRSEPPFAWLIPPDERNPRAPYELLERLRIAGVDVHQATAPFEADGIPYPEGTHILYCAQPFRSHLKDMMERQSYPDRLLYPGGPPERPYDITGWTLPLQIGTRAAAVAVPFECEARKLDAIPFPQGTIEGGDNAAHYAVVSGTNDDFAFINRLFKAEIPFRIYTGGKPILAMPDGNPAPPGSLWIEDGAKVRDAMPELLEGISANPIGLDELNISGESVMTNVRQPKLGLYQPWTASMDEGWTRLVLENFEFPYTSMHNADVRAGNLITRYDCIVLPSVSVSSLVNGAPPESTEPRYVGGIGQDGIVNLQDFVRAGGTLVCIDESCNLPIRYFNIPVKNIVADIKPSEFYCPGSLLRVSIDTEHPVGFGLPRMVSGFFRRSQAFEIDAPDKEDNDEKGNSEILIEKRPARIVARYSDTLLLDSGWIMGEDTITGKPAVVEVTVGKGRIILLGFRVQHRAQTRGTFRLLFNSILSSEMDYRVTTSEDKGDEPE